MKTILIIDDEEFLRESIAGTLSLNGYNVIQAESCKEAIKAVKQNHIDLILSDIKMPEKDGIQTYEEIKKIKHIKVVFMSGFYTEEQGLAIQKLHSKILQKPFKKEELFEVIENTLK